MSGRTRITDLVLMNWRGVFYHRFRFDRHITALEGGNGAGKTTAMIAAYVVLMPDLSLVRFGTVTDGDTGGDRGLYGRLGGRVAYSVLAFELADGGRLLAGVKLEQKAAPRVEATPFVVTGLGEVDLEAVLLRRDGGLDTIPTLVELSRQVGRAGGHLHRFRNLGEYFGALFDHGVAPRRMTGRKERQRWNQMLHTSMYGGLSSSIQGSLREYLLSEDATLRTHVARMREALEASRRTRRQLETTTREYDRLHAVYSAGWGMLEAGFHAARGHAQEVRTTALQLRTRHHDARRAAAQASADEADAHRAHRVAMGALADATDQADEARDLAQRHEEAARVAAALAVAADVVVAAEATVKRAAALLAAADRRFVAATQREDTLRARLRDLNRERGDLGRAWEQIIARVRKYRVAVRALSDARERLGDLEPEAAERHLAAAVASGAVAESEVADLRGALEADDDHRARFAEGLAALERLVGGAVVRADAAGVAERADADAREQAVRAAGRDDLRRALPEVRDRARRQAVARALADVLDPPVVDAAGARAADREAREAVSAAARSRGTHDAALAAAGERTKALRADLARREADLTRWSEAREAGQRLEQIHGVELGGARDLRTLEARTRGRLRAAEEEAADAAHHLAACVAEADELEQTGGRLDPRLLALRDALDCRLAAEGFEGVAAGDAAEVEARLGPLHDALVVDDVEGAAALLTDGPARPDEVWLLEATPKVPDGPCVGDAVLVEAGAGAWRLTRQPERPTVGRAAREAEVLRLRVAASEAKAALAEAERRRVDVSEALAGLREATEHAAWWSLAAPDVAEVEAALVEVREEMQAAREGRDAAVAEARRAAARAAGLAELMGDADLLDAGDLAAEVEALAGRLADAETAAAWVESNAADVAQLRASHGVLAHPPADPARRAELAARLEAARSERMQLGVLRERLETVVATRADLEYAGQEALLAKNEGAGAALDAEFARLEPEHTAATEALASARDSDTTSRAALAEAEGQLRADRSVRDGHSEALSALEADPSADALAAARGALAQAQTALADAQTAERALDRAVAAAEEATRHRRVFAEELRSQRADAVRKWRPRHRNWMAVRRAARSADVARRLLEPEVVARYAQVGSINANAAARRHEDRLAELLVEAPGGAPLAQMLGEMRTVDGLLATAQLEVWLAVRRWLGTLIPRDVVQSDDPLTAMERLRAHIDGLRGHMEQQESDLRQRADGIANGIGVRIRKETTEIRKLNDDLGRVSFGAVASVRIQVERVPALQRLLEALKTQLDLFDTDERLEDALARLFQRVGGGRIAGERLLDYREYMRLSVEVMRKGSSRWEQARPASLSTGEAIGTGAAVLVVVLRSWERAAKQAYGRAATSLRFLFLDEATRLSQDSLDTLVEFCERMDIQLLIAAPQVARARRGITHRLVRRTDEQGREQVVVRGRTGFAGA